MGKPNVLRDIRYLRSSPNSGNARTPFDVFRADDLKTESAYEQARFIAHIIARGVFTTTVADQLREIWGLDSHAFKLIVATGREIFDDVLEATDESREREAVSRFETVYSEAITAFHNANARQEWKAAASFLAIANAAASKLADRGRSPGADGEAPVFRVEVTNPERPGR